MSKIITIPCSLDEINKTKNLVDGFIIGIKDLCINSNFDIEDLSVLNQLNDREIFINLNKNMVNGDLNKLERVLLELNNYNIKGVLFYDICVLNISRRLNLNYDLIISQEHSITNASTINYWNDKGAKYAYLSSEITALEIEKISKNTKSKLMINLFGYLPMFASKRRIVKNYLDYFNMERNSELNYIEKENNVYPIKDNNLGTIVYSSNILNGIKYSLISVDYIVLNGFGIELESFIKVLDMFKSANKSNILEYEKTINNMFPNADTGFLEKKTIYKVIS